MKEDFIGICQENSMKIHHSLGGEVGLMKTKLEKCEEKSEDMETYNRKEAVIISGTAVPAASTNEDCNTLVVGLLRDEFQYSASTEKLVTAHRLENPPSASNQDKRQVIAKFCNHQDKNDVVSAAKALRKVRIEFPTVVTGSCTQNGANCV